VDLSVDRELSCQRLQTLVMRAVAEEQLAWGGEDHHSERAHEVIRSLLVGKTRDGPDHRG
jgi:hypothetical protein